MVARTDYCTSGKMLAIRKEEKYRAIFEKLPGKIVKVEPWVGQVSNLSPPCIVVYFLTVPDSEANAHAAKITKNSSFFQNC